MAAVDGLLGVARHLLRVRQPGNVLPSFGQQLVDHGLGDRALLGRVAERVAVLRADDRHAGPQAAQLAHERLEAFPHHLRVHVPQAVQHIAARVDGGEMLAHL